MMNKCVFRSTIQLHNILIKYIFNTLEVIKTNCKSFFYKIKTFNYKLFVSFLVYLLK